MFFFDDYVHEETFWEVLENCVGPSIIMVLNHFVILLGINFLFNLIVRFGQLSYTCFHCVSMVLGAFVMYHLVLKTDIVIHLVFLFVGYVLLYVAHELHWCLRNFCRLSAIYLVHVGCVLFLIYGEFYYKNKELWLKSRGIAMIAVMKIISISSNNNYGPDLPSLFAFGGYMLCPANSIFGPWFTIRDYMRLNEVYNSLNIKWIVKILKTSVIALIFLSISNCFGEYLIKDYSLNWFIAYRKALCFRTSHYFVSYLSEATMITAGYNQLVQDVQGRWEYTVTNPLDVEFPRALASVVIAWNIPAHRFLKLYLYIIYLPYGKGTAILLTFLFSALLHGMNVEITLVLLSLGGFSYIQSLTQQMFSDILNACVKIRPCNNCQHRFKAMHPLTLIINFSFMILNIIHLAYLGCVMDAVSEKKSVSETILEWESLGLASHHMFVFLFVVYCVFNDLFGE